MPDRCGWRDAVARAAVVLVSCACVAAASPARADVSDLDGHVSIGYSHLVISDSPGGSMSVAAGIGYPLNSQLRIGGDIGFYLLGSRTEEEGSAVANVDYSMFEVALLAHWRPTWAGPIARFSVGPTVSSAHADLSTSGGGLAFKDLAVEEVAPGAALDVTLLMGNPASPVRAGVEFGLRQVFLENKDDWTLVSARLAIHY